METFLNDDSLDFETQTDIETLLENVKCQNGNELNQEQAFLALAALCSSQVRSRNVVLNREFMAIIHQILSNNEISQKLSMASTFLIACAVSGSARGQFLILETGCLADVLKLFRNLIAEECKDLSHWTTVTQAISFCIGNPQNEKNQNVCCCIIPSALKMVHECLHYKIVQHILNLIGLIVVNNVGNQNRLHKCGGLDILIDMLSTLMQPLRPRDKLFYEISASVISALDLCVADNETSIKKSVEMGLVHQIFGILKDIDRHSVDISIFLLILTHLFEHIDNPRKLLLECKGRDWLVKCLTESEEEEVFKAIKYIFILCNSEVEEDNRLTLPVREMNEKDRSFVKSARMKSGCRHKNIRNAASLSNPSIVKNVKSKNDLRGMVAQNSTHNYRNGFLETSLLDSSSIKASSRSEKDASHSRIKAMRHEEKSPKCHTFQANSEFGLSCHQTADAFSDRFLPAEYSRCCCQPSSFNCGQNMDNSKGDWNDFVQPASPIGILTGKKALHLNSHVNTTPLVNQNSYFGRKRTNENNLHGKSSVHSLNNWIRDTQNNYRPQEPELYDCFHKSPKHNKHQDVHSTIPSYQNFPQNNGRLPGKINGSNSRFLPSLRKDGEVSSKSSLFIPQGYVQRTPEGVVQDLPLLDIDTGDKIHLSERSREQTSLYQSCRWKQYSDTTQQVDGSQDTHVTTLFSRIQNIQVMISSLLDDIPVGQDPSSFEEDRTGLEENSKWIEKQQSWLSSGTKPKHSNTLMQSNNDASSCHMSLGQRQRQIVASKPTWDSLSDEDDGQTTLSVSTMNYGNRNDNSSRNRRVKEVKKKSYVRKNKADIIQALKSIIASNEQSEDKINDTHHIYQRQRYKDSFERMTVSCPDTASVNQIKDQNDNRTIYIEADSTNWKPEGKQKHNNLRKVKVIPTIHLSSQISEHFVPGGEDSEKAFGKSTASSHGNRSFSTPRHHSDLSIVEKRLRPSTLHSSSSFEKGKGDFCNNISSPQSLLCHEARSSHSFPSHCSISSHTAGVSKTISLLREDNSLPESQGYENQFVHSRYSNDIHVTTNRPTSPVCEKPAPQQTTQKIEGNMKSSNHEEKPVRAVFTEEDQIHEYVYNESVEGKADQCTHKADNFAASEVQQSFHSEVQQNNSRQPCLSDTKPQTPQGKGFNRGPNDKTGPSTLGPAGDAKLYDDNSRDKAGCPQSRVMLPAKRRLNADNLGQGSPKNSSSREDEKQEEAIDKLAIYQFQSEDESKKARSSSHSDMTTSIRDPHSKDKNMFRRIRIPYSDQEVLNLRHGVATVGTKWQLILNTYQFHQSRTAVDLKEKFKRLMGTKKKLPVKDRHSRLPFSKCEIRRLARGVKMFGHNWKAILAGERFLPGRSAQDLCSKWRTLIKKENI